MSEATFDPTKYNNSNNEPFSSILDKEVSRRGLIQKGSGIAALSMLSGFGLVGCDDDDNTNTTEPAKTLGFNGSEERRGGQECCGQRGVKGWP